MKKLELLVVDIHQPIESIWRIGATLTGTILSTDFRVPNGTFMMMIYGLLILPLSFYFAYAADDSAVRVTVRFYGEAQCPFCRKFVMTFNDIWNDPELRQYLDYDFVPWGNAYFSTDKCGSGPYDPQERACWYEECITQSSDDEDACFGGNVVYQHGNKEGNIDIYESCILQDVGLDAAVDFTFCCEGPNMDDGSMCAQQLMQKCIPKGVNPENVQKCLETRGRKIEIANAKKTPAHPGVPYVLVDNESLDNPLEVRQAICDQLSSKGVQPTSCQQHQRKSHHNFRKQESLTIALSWINRLIPWRCGHLTLDQTIDQPISK